MTFAVMTAMVGGCRFGAEKIRGVSSFFQRCQQAPRIRGALWVPLDGRLLLGKRNHRRPHSRHLLKGFPRMTHAVLAGHAADGQFRAAAGGCLGRSGAFVESRWHSIAVSFLL